MFSSQEIGYLLVSTALFYLAFIALCRFLPKGLLLFLNRIRERLFLFVFLSFALFAVVVFFFYGKETIVSRLFYNKTTFIAAWIYVNIGLIPFVFDVSQRRRR